MIINPSVYQWMSIRYEVCMRVDEFRWIQLNLKELDPARLFKM